MFGPFNRSLDGMQRVLESKNAIGIALVYGKAGNFGKVTRAPDFYIFERAGKDPPRKARLNRI